MDIGWQKVVGSVAPLLATALGGPLAGTAVKFLADNFLGDSNATSEDIELAVRGASTETLLKLKELDLQFKTEMEKLGITREQLGLEYYKTDAADRGNAREREIQTGSRINSWLAATVVVGFFVVVGYVLSGRLEMSAASASIIGTLIGYVSAKADQVLSYYFGGNPPGSLVKSAQGLQQQVLDGAKKLVGIAPKQ